MASSSVTEFDTDKLFDFVKLSINEEVATVLKDNDVSGDDFIHLTEPELQQMFSKVGQKKKIQKLLEECRSQSAAATSDGSQCVKSLVNKWDKRVAEEHKATLRPAKPMKSKSKCIEKGPKDIYQLPRTCVLDDKRKGVAKYTIGKQPATHSRPHEYVVMVVGATGAGKTTLINGMANFIFGVEWKDSFRFKLIDDGKGSQAHSKTKTITAYSIHKQDGSPFPNTLTIIDTPGFGDTEGLERDKQLVGQVHEFFSMGGMKGIDCIHAIGFVTQASMARLTHTQRYIFDSILSIFGKDIESNIILMTTFADGKRPPVLAAVTEAKVPYCKAFQFNNSALFPEPQDKRSANEFGDHFSQMYWALGEKSFEEFFKQLVTMPARSLTLTKEVLDERRQLESVIQGLQQQMKVMVGKIDQLKQERTLMQENKAKIAANENFTYTVTAQKIIKHDIAGTGRNVTNCLLCNFTCHDDCRFANDADKKRCNAMKDGLCTVCPKGCPWDKHVNNPWWFEVIEQEEERTYEELKQRYDEATEKASRVQVMVANIEAQITQMYDMTGCMIGEARKKLQRLDEIALKPNPLSQVEYIDLLIQSEQEQAKEGYLKRIECLREIRQQAKLMTSVRDESQLHEGYHEAGKIAIASRRPTDSSWKKVKGVFANIWSKATS